MGLLVSIFRPAHFADCTNGGISSRERDAKGLCLVNVSGPSSPSADYPPAMLEVRTPFGDEVGRRCVRVVAAVDKGHGVYEKAPGWAMMGGHYAATSDSRFHEAVTELTGLFVNNGAVPIHDRYE